MVIVRSLCDRSEVLFPDFVNDVNMVVGQGVQTVFGFGERGGEVDVGDFESGTAQPVGVVAAVDAPVVVLAENVGSLSRIGDRVVFEGFFARKSIGDRTTPQPPGFRMRWSSRSACRSSSTCSRM